MVVTAAAAAAVVVVVVVVRGGNLAFGTHTFSTFYAQHTLLHVLRRALPQVVHRTLNVLVLHLSPKGKRGR